MLSQKQKASKDNFNNVINQLLGSFPSAQHDFKKTLFIKNYLGACSSTLLTFYDSFYKKTDEFMEDVVEIRFHLSQCEKNISNATKAQKQELPNDIVSNLLSLAQNHASLAKAYFDNLSTEDCN